MSKKVETPSKEAFDEWRENPVAEWFFGVFQNAPDKLADQWKNESFFAGNNDGLRLAELRGTAIAYKRIVDFDYYDLTGETRPEDGGDNAED